MKISEFAKRSGVTVKTLLHYDKIGLLQPSLKTEVGYRIYCDEYFNYSEEEFVTVGYGPKVDSPSSVEELKNCFLNFDFTIEVHKLHPLVGVIIASKN